MRTMIFFGNCGIFRNNGKMVALCEEAVGHIMPYCNDEVEMILEDNNGEQRVPATVLHHLEKELKVIESLFQAGNYNNNIFDSKKYLEHFHGLK